ncbi:MAG: uroporphyrinogen-III synthase [Xanthobacteraceae bacterium]
MRLLVTRPPPDGERSAEALRRRGHQVMVSPMLRIQLTEFVVPNIPYRAVVLTSSNAARAVAQHRERARLTALPVYTVGERSAASARAAGFADVVSAGGDRDDLVRLLRSRCAGSSEALLYLAGEEQAGELAACGSPVELVLAYRALKADRLPKRIAAAISTLEGVLHFSRRSAEAYLECTAAAEMLEAALAPRHFCLAPAVAQPLVAAGAAAVHIAPRPNEAALIELVAS